MTFFIRFDLITVLRSPLIFRGLLNVQFPYNCLAVVYTGCRKNVQAKLGIVIRQVSADSERASSHRENKPYFIKISQASQNYSTFSAARSALNHDMYETEWQ